MPDVEVVSRSKVTVRPAGTSDIAIIISLAKTIWPKAFDGIIPHEQIGPMVESIYHPEALRDEMDTQGHRFWLAYDDDAQPIAYASAYQQDQALWIKKLYVLPSMQGRGVGKALIQAAQEYFPAAHSLALYVHRDNEAAIAFYTRLGMRVIGEAPVQMGPYRFIDYVMQKPLRQMNE